VASHTSGGLAVAASALGRVHQAVRTPEQRLGSLALPARRYADAGGDGEVEVAAAQAVSEGTADLAQKPVAGGVAVAVVDGALSLKLVTPRSDVGTRFRGLGGASSS
jgi:hypothetical protein